MWGFVKGIFSGSTVKAIENIALEAINTDIESAEAKAIMVKTLDPNGVMRRELSQFASKMYGFYLIATVCLIIMHYFGLGDPSASESAIKAMTELFMPITTAWGAIVGASFGVNGANVIKGS